MAVLGVVAAICLLAAAGLAVTAVRLRSRAGATRAPRVDPAARLAGARTEAVAIVARAREEAVAAREASLDEIAARSEALEAVERRLADRAHELDERRRAADERRTLIDDRRAELDADGAELGGRRAEVDARRDEIAGIDPTAAAATVLGRIEAELANDHPGRVQRAISTDVGDVVPTATSLIEEAIQRQEASHVDSAPRGTPIPLEGLSDESRERLLNALAVVGDATATELGVDPERSVATLRGLDPVGREVARQASLEVLERRLSAEEVSPLLLRTRRDLLRDVTQRGERALWEMGIEGRPELAELLGTLHYRFSYGQNALLHCQETGHLCAVLAAELRLDQGEARSAGLLHDIGKAVDHDVEGSHAIIGGELLSLLGTDSGIVHAVKAHHFDEEPATDLAMLAICADAISASRPGARRDTLTTYLQRLEQLQQIATRHAGVERAFPMQAGREVRIAVRPEQVPDARVAELCTEIAREIEAEMTYPGMIKVTVIRETSASATAS